MAIKLFVGGLAYAIKDEELRAIFETIGTVQSAQVIVDRETNRSKGFGFIEMASDDEAKAAINALNGKEVEGRSITVNEAKPKENHERRSFDGGRPRQNNDRRNDRNSGGRRY